ncbi:MAG: glutamine synthetase family protein [Lachnospiraceae bacterium]|nr:glutamine synthetase family protein [Lachnospiraceae bacterium]
MIYTKREVMEYVENEDVKFIRLAFCDINGVQKNISIMPTELERAFENGISIDASAVEGFKDYANSDLFLFPDPSTLTILPWRPTHGKVVRLFCNIKQLDRSPFVADCRYILQQAVAYALEHKIQCNFGSEFEFYLFLNDENGQRTNIPHDEAGFMDIAPLDKGENVRREICLTLEQMDIQPESSHHEQGPGQHEVDFKYSDALTAADNAIHFASVVRTVAARNGLTADFSPKPLEGKSGNGLHINMSAVSLTGADVKESYMAGIMAHIKEITAFLNPTEESYHRLGEKNAPSYITWSSQNRGQLLRVPESIDHYSKIELRSADCGINPYLAYAALIYAGIDGIENQLTLPPALDQNISELDPATLSQYELLPQSLNEAKIIMKNSDFIKKFFPQELIEKF